MRIRKPVPLTDHHSANAIEHKDWTERHDIPAGLAVLFVTKASIQSSLDQKWLPFGARNCRTYTKKQKRQSKIGKCGTRTNVRMSVLEANLWRGGKTIND